MEMEIKFKTAEEWLMEGWASIPVNGRARFIREIQVNAMREAAKIVASGKSYRFDADPLYESAYDLEQVAISIEKGKYKAK